MQDFVDIGKRFLVFTTSRAALLIARWAVLVVLIKQLPIQEFAYIAAVMAACDILRAISDFGTGSLIHAKLGISKNSLSNSLKSLIAFRIYASAFVSAAGAMIFVSMGGKPELIPLFGLPAIAGVQVTASALIHRSNNHKKTHLATLFSIAALLFILNLPGETKRSTQVYVLLLIIPDLINAIVICFFARHDVRSCIIYSKNSAKYFLLSLKSSREKLAQGVMISVLIIGYNRLDFLIVLPMLGNIEQANYSAAIRLLEPLYTIFSTLSLSLLAELGSQSADRSKLLSKRIVELIGMATYLKSILASVFSAIICASVIHFLLDLSADATIVAAIIGATIPVKALNSMTSSLITKAMRIDVILKAALLNATAIVFIALMLTPLLGIAGCALAVSVGEIINGQFQRKYIKENL